MSPDFTDDDIGKSVVNANGEEVGIVADVEHGTAHVEPDPGITDTIKAALGWGSTDAETYPLQEESIARVTNDEIRLEGGAGTGPGTDTGTDIGSTGDETAGTGMDTETGGTTGTAGTGTDTDRSSGITDDDDDLLGDDNDDRRSRNDDEGLLGDDNDDRRSRNDDEGLLGDDDEDDDDDLIGDDTNTR